MVVVFNINFFTGKLTQSMLFLRHDIPGIGDFLLGTLWLVPVALLALYLGMQIRKRIAAERYLQILRGVLWTMAGILFVRFVYSYIG